MPLVIVGDIRKTAHMLMRSGRRSTDGTAAV